MQDASFVSSGCEAVEWTNSNITCRCPLYYDMTQVSSIPVDPTFEPWNSRRLEAKDIQVFQNLDNKWKSSFVMSLVALAIKVV